MLQRKVRVIITNDQEDIKIPTGVRMLMRRVCTAALQGEHFTAPAEVNVRFVDNETIRALNQKHREIDAVTDVLSFPLGEEGVYDVNPETGAQMLGDIVINIQRAVAQAQTYEHTLQREICFLTVHSILHLLGYDHEGGGLDMVRMREKEEAALTQVGLVRNGSYFAVEH
ncbi:MAG: rRNA maturation RNase YbeY [Oscillospiraceae bacterium]|jgi:probable rRNA maturation factor|nr:rRNA maturation RNase YbeY [Oscillospiraceae bacterium]